MSGCEFTRRRFVTGAVAATLASGVRSQSELSAGQSSAPHTLYWGDLHNHNAVGYAQGSLARSIDLAREHLDFFAFTGHASWHDMPEMPGDRHMKWVRGFEVHAKHWPRTRQMIADANDDEFVAILGYEWHSSHFGDYCLLFDSDQQELFLPDHVDKLLDFAEANQALAIPHHVGYLQGWRGANWKHFRASVSPVVEIFSEHGCTESDRAPFPMIRHSMSGRWTANTIARQLARGLRFGFVASSDDHRGYPGAYGEGVVGVWAEELTAAAIFRAVRERRCYAATGDRIALETTLNGLPMGAQLPATAERQFDVRVEGQDSLESVELIRNGRVIERHFPEDAVDGPPKLPGRAKLRIQYGWGPWGALDLDRTCAWDMRVELRGATLHRVLGCFQSAPFGENLRDRLRQISDNELRLTSHTTRRQAYAEDPTKAIVCEIDAEPDAALSIILRSPSEQTITTSLRKLLTDNLVAFTGPFTSESLIISRLVAPEEYATRVTWEDRRPASTRGDNYYVRVKQHNGHCAWSSPFWVG